MSPRGQHYKGGCKNCDRYASLGRRGFLGLLGLGVASLVGVWVDGTVGRSETAARSAKDLLGSSGSPNPYDDGLPAGPAVARYEAFRDHPEASTPPSTSNQSSISLDSIPAPHPGPPVLVSRGPRFTDQIALTIDDGYCAGCVASYVEFAQSSGIHITFSPNGVYGGLWAPHAPVLRPLIEAGQVQIGNHTFKHLDLTRLPDSRVRTELERNDEWIQTTFGITARPWYRPPFGHHDSRTDELAGQLGFTRILMWNGSFGDATLLTPQVLMAQAVKYLKPGTVMLGHANHPTVTHLFPQIQSIIEQRKLQPVTLDEMFGTSRATG